MCGHCDDPTKSDAMQVCPDCGEWSHVSCTICPAVEPVACFDPDESLSPNAPGEDT